MVPYEIVTISTGRFSSVHSQLLSELLNSINLTKIMEKLQKSQKMQKVHLQAYMANLWYVRTSQIAYDTSVTMRIVLWTVWLIEAMQVLFTIYGQDYPYT